MTRNGLATEPTEAETTVDAALHALLDHVSRLLAEEYVALVQDGSRRRARVHKENER